MKVKYQVAIATALIVAAGGIIVALINNSNKETTINGTITINGSPEWSTNSNNNSGDGNISENGENENNSQESDNSIISIPTSNSYPTESSKDLTVNPSSVPEKGPSESITGESTDLPDVPIISVPVRDFLSPNISAYRQESYLTITVNKELPKSLNENKVYPFKWGLHLKDRLGNDNIGDYIIELEICVDNDGTVLDTDSCVLLATDNDITEPIKDYLSKINVIFDGENYVISCDIENEYVSTESICVNTVYHY